VSGFETQADQIHDVILNLKAHGQTISPTFRSLILVVTCQSKGCWGRHFTLFSVLQSVPCLSRMAFEVQNGVIPYGDTALYLPYDKIHAIKAVTTRFNPDRAAGLSQPGAAENQPVEGSGDGKPLFGTNPQRG
jgi:hypothetical protein